jgi:DNA/RNA-binding domain of Phe-tRNA-synthetase-like protein
LRSPYPRLSLSYTEIYYYELLLYFKLKALYYIIVQMTRAKKSGLGGSAMELKISDEVRTLCPDTALGVLFYRAEVAESPQALLDKFDDAQRTLGERYTLETIADIPHIASTRDAYRALGKSPHEYRNAAEAMLRRIVKGSGLYRINNVVDVNNLISVSSGYSIGSYDVSGLSGGVTLHRAQEGSHYDGIGKESVNIGRLPVLYDALGPFGNPSSDSRRAMIRPGRRDVMSVVYSFDGDAGLREWLPRFAALLEKYSGASEPDIKYIL